MDALDHAAIEAVLRSVGYGFLGLTSGDRPYVLPMSFGYDGGDVYFQMNDEGRKIEIIGDGAPACLTALDFDAETGVARSVIVEGVLAPVGDARGDAAFEALAANADFGTDISLWGKQLTDADVTLYRLTSAEASGRVFGEAHDPTSVPESGSTDGG